MNSLCATLFAGLLLLVSSSARTEIYKCADAQGGTRYSDRPCADNAVIIAPERAPAVSEDAAGRRDRTQRLLRAYEAEHQESQRKEAEQKAEQENRKRQCVAARRYQRGVTQASRVFRTDDAGQRVDLSFEERAVVEAKARAEVARWCDSK